MNTRREFLKSWQKLGAVGAGMHLARLGVISANAQSTSTYRALVCIFLLGGNDGNNTVVPLSTAGQTAYRNGRRGIALAASSLLPIGANNNTESYGLHPRLSNVQRLYNARKAAAVLNVGTLVRPTVKADLNGSLIPRNLYSHSDQTAQWQTGNLISGAGTGWAGRVNDLLAASNAGSFPPGVSVSGNNLLLNGAQTTPVTLNGNGFGLDSFGDGRASTARVAAYQNLLTFDTGVRLIGAASGMVTNAVRNAQTINAALAGAPNLATVFPATGLGQQLRQVAQVIQVRSALGMNRQIFFCSMGGFDNHENLLPEHDRLMALLDGAVGAFHTATLELGVESNVTTFTESEFGRTMGPSTKAGSDHAWGSHHFVVGGAVRGGEVYGTMPDLTLGGPADAGNRGLWIPTISLDQYAATLAQWYGVGAGSLTPVFPNLANFSTQTLSFL